MQKGNGASASLPASPPTLDAAVSGPDVASQILNSDRASQGGIIAQLSGNPFFTAGFGLAGLGAAATLGRRGARHGAALLRRRLLVDVEINVQDDSYQWFLYWMTLHQRAQLGATIPKPKVVEPSNRSKPGWLESFWGKLTPGMRHLSIETEKIVLPNGAIHTNFVLIPGPGKHVLRYKGAFIFVNRVREEKSRDYKTGAPWETITLTTLYSHRHVFESLFKEAHDIAAQSQEGKTVIYHSRGIEWKPFGNPRRKRPLESVILDAGVKEAIVADVKEFLSSSKWYYDRGIPYRRGYLLHGPPGTGKSSFIQALAGELDYDIALLNLSERGLTDDRLNHLLTIVPPRTMVLLEDVDVAFANRRIHSDPDGYQGPTVTFSGLLNALDGVASAEERIIFLTTNYVERLDSALVRPGRVDMTVRLGEATRYQVEQLWNRFYGEHDECEKSKRLFCERLQDLGLLGSSGQPAPKRMTSTAALQGIFLYNKADMQGAISMADLLLQNGQNENAGTPVVAVRTEFGG